MGRILMTGGGGGADLDVITAEADDILSGKVIVDKDGNPLTGTLTLSGDAGAGDVLSGKTFYTTNPKSKQTGTMGTMGGGTYGLWSFMALSCSRFLQWDNSLCSPYHRLRCSDRSMPLPGRFILPFRRLWYSCENESTSF